MIWLLLTWLSYAAALSATLGAVGYVAATRFSLVQRLLATVVDRALNRLADSGQAAYTVTHTDTGAVVAVAVAAGSGGAAQSLAALQPFWCLCAETGEHELFLCTTAHIRTWMGRLQAPSLSAAAASHRLPCLACLPAHLPARLPAPLPRTPTGPSQAYGPVAYAWRRT